MTATTSRADMDEAKRRPEWENTFRVGVYTCKITYRPGADLKAEWRPSMPRRLSDQAWDEYRAGRDALMGEVAAGIGNVLVIEL
jgi:hypothetical protein